MAKGPFRVVSVLRNLLLSACVLPAVPVSAQVAELRPGEPRWFELAEGAVAEVAFDVEADRFVHLEVRQDGTDVVATVVDPAGAVIGETDTAILKVIETISWTRSRAGRHTLRVRVRSAPTGARFEVLLDPPRPAADSDEAWLRSERTFVEVMRQPATTRTERDAATKALRRLLESWRALADERWVALTQMVLGAEYYDGDAERGLGDCQAAADYAERSGDATVENAFSCTAAHLSNLGFLEDAVRMSRKLLARQQQAGASTSTTRMSALNLSLHLITAGRTSEAATLLEDLLRDADASGDLVVQAFGRAHLGRLHRERGEYQQALDDYTRALEIPHPYAGIRPAHRAALASVQLAIGDLGAAFASAQRAMAEARRSFDPRSESLALQVMGRVHAERGEPGQAIALLSENVALCRRKNLAVLEVDGLLALGRAEAARGRRSVARRHQGDALARSRSFRYPGGEALALAALCALDDAEGVSGEACRASLSTALAIGHGPTALLSRYYLAHAARRRGALEEARVLLEQALGAVGAQRGNLRRSDLRQTFSATLDDIEDEYVDLLVELADEDPSGPWERRAFEASERARGRSLSDELAEARADVRRGADPALLEEDRNLRDRLRASMVRQLQGTASSGAQRDLERDVASLQARLADVEARIRLANPRYAALDPSAAPTLEAIRAALLGDGSALLFYALGPRRSFLWVVTPSVLERHALPPQAALERLARQGLDALSLGPQGAPARPLAALGRLLLAPAREHLGTGQVIVVPDGALHYVPFAALPDPRGGGPLVQRSEIAQLPSAAAGVTLAQAAPPAWTKDVAVFADPVFRADDERVVARRSAERPAKAASLPRELTHGRNGLARLPFTRREAHAIERLAGLRGRVALDFDASRATVLEEGLSSYRFVHFATHGLLNATRPELSGIVLSLVDRNGRPQDGFLTSLDTFNLRLDADLVVLSGCRTALGRNVRSEGIVGLTRGFMYAGARGVLASLWPVDDAATAELMRAFYAGLLGPRRLLPPAALREAQLELRKDPRWRAPYYWAAFQLQGVWSTGGASDTSAAHPEN